MADSHDASKVYLGRVVESPRSYSPTESEIVEFARRWDPLPLHTDKEAAARTVFGGLTAPGVMTDAILIRLVHTAVHWPPGALIGMVGAEDVRYLQPVRPGDELSLRGEVVSLKRSQSNPGRAVAKIRWELRRADGQLVYARTNIVLFHAEHCALEEQARE